MSGSGQKLLFLKISRVPAASQTVAYPDGPMEERQPKRRLSVWG
jgi:hypothetical protein